MVFSISKRPAKDFRPFSWITDVPEKPREEKGGRDSPAGALCNGDNERLPDQALTRVSASHVHKVDSRSQRNTETSASGASQQRPSCSHVVLQKDHTWPVLKPKEHQTLLKRLQGTSLAIQWLRL